MNHMALQVASEGVSIDRSRRRILVDGVTLHVTPIEYRLLEHLVRSAGSIVAREELLAAARQRETVTAGRSLDVHVSHLRKKLDTRRHLIRTIRGAGYVFGTPGRAFGPAGHADHPGSRNMARTPLMGASVSAIDPP